MAIALVNSGNASFTASDPIGLAFTANAGANLLVSFMLSRSGTTVVSVDYAGAPMVLGKTLTDGSRGVHIAYQYGPLTGKSQNVNWDMSGATTCRITNAAFSGVNTQYLPNGATESGTGANPDVPIDCPRLAGCIVAGCVDADTSIFEGFGAGQTVISHNQEASGSTASTYDVTSVAGIDVQSFTQASAAYVVAGLFFAASDPAVSAYDDAITRPVRSRATSW